MKEEQDRIMKVFTDTCVERVTQSIKSEYALELYADERKKLEDSMETPAWNKLDENSKNFLISSKVMYTKLAVILEYVKRSILKTYASTHSDEDIHNLLSDYVTDVERVRENYRNKAAHTNALTKTSATECFNLVLDDDKLLKKMLDSFDF